LECPLYDRSLPNCCITVSDATGQQATSSAKKHRENL
jgi:hypothetical protein